MDEFQHYSAEAKAGVLFIRALADAGLREAMDLGTAGFLKVSAFMGPETNPSWITGQAAEEAYMRGLIDEFEFDYRRSQ